MDHILFSFILLILFILSKQFLCEPERSCLRKRNPLIGITSRRLHPKQFPVFRES